MNVAKHFGYYDNWQTAELKCPHCGWTGTFSEGWEDDFSHVMDSRCPSCDMHPIVAIVVFPTLQDMEANWDKLSEGEKKLVALKRLEPPDAGGDNPT